MYIYINNINIIFSKQYGSHGGNSIIVHPNFGFDWFSHGTSIKRENNK